MTIEQANEYFSSLPEGFAPAEELRAALTADVQNVQFVGGCSGNTQGVARLIDGMDIDEAISRIEGIQCGFRPTSCPDQLAQALKEYKANVK